MNNVTLAGKLTKAPESKVVGENTVVRFGLAVRRRFKGKDGKDVDFFDCEAWRKQGEIVGRFLTKGSFAVISGELRNDSWEKDGQKHTKTIVNVENVSLGPNTTPKTDEPQENGGGGSADQDIPF